MENNQPKVLQFDATAISTPPTKAELQSIFTPNGEKEIVLNADDTIRVIHKGTVKVYNPTMFFIKSDQKVLDGINGWIAGKKTQVSPDTMSVDLSLGAFAYQAALACNYNFDQEIVSFPLRVNVMRVNAALAVVEAAIKDGKAKVALKRDVYIWSMLLSAPDAKGALAEAARVLMDSKWQARGVRFANNLPDVRNASVSSEAFSDLGTRIESAIASGLIAVRLDENSATLSIKSLKRADSGLLESAAVLNSFFADQISVWFVKS